MQEHLIFYMHYIHVEITKKELTNISQQLESSTYCSMNNQYLESVQNRKRFICSE